jgi:thymidylate kinase
LFKPRSKKVFLTKSPGVAFIGSDGAGKSTLLRDVSKWLGWKLEVKRVYMGSQQPSLPTWLALWIWRLPHFLRKRLRIHLDNSANLLVWWETQTFNLYQLLVAFDRRRRFFNAQQASRAGIPVLFDRYPVPELYASMDGPRIAAKGPLGKRLSSIEKKAYSQIRLPSRVLILKLNAATAHRRKPEHSFESITMKAGAISKLSKKPKRNFVIIDAERKYPSVLSDAKKAIWEVLD